MKTPSAILAAVLSLSIAVAPASAQIQSAVTRIGVAGAVQGKVAATMAGPKQVGRVITSGKPLFLNDKIETGPDSHLQIMLADETVFTLGPNSSMVLDEFFYDPKKDSGGITAKINKGTFRFITGRIGHKNPSDMKVKFPVGTMGIRGTIVAGEVTENSTMAVLLGPGPATRAPGERIGAFTLFGGGGSSAEVNRPGYYTHIDGLGGHPSIPVLAPQAVLNSIQASLTAGKFAAALPRVAPGALPPGRVAGAPGAAPMPGGVPAMMPGGPTGAFPGAIAPVMAPAISPAMLAAMPETAAVGSLAIVPSASQLMAVMTNMMPAPAPPPMPGVPGGLAPVAPGAGAGMTPTAAQAAAIANANAMALAAAAGAGNAPVPAGMAPGAAAAMTPSATAAAIANANAIALAAAVAADPTLAGSVAPGVMPDPDAAGYIGPGGIYVPPAAYIPPPPCIPTAGGLCAPAAAPPATGVTNSFWTDLIQNPQLGAGTYTGSGTYYVASNPTLTGTMNFTLAVDFGAQTIGGGSSNITLGANAVAIPGGDSTNIATMPFGTIATNASILLGSPITGGANVFGNNSSNAKFNGTSIQIMNSPTNGPAYGAQVTLNYTTTGNGQAAGVANGHR